MNKEFRKVTNLVLDLERLHALGHTLLPEEYYFLHQIYNYELYGFDFDWTKQLNFANIGAQLGHPMLRDFIVNLYLHQHKRYVWGSIVPTEEECERWLQESTDPDIHKEYLARIYGKGTEKYNQELFQFAYDYYAMYDLAKYYYDGIGCEQNTTIANYWAWFVDTGENDNPGYQMLQEHAPQEARIPDGGNDIIKDDVIREAACQTGDRLVLANEILWKKAEHEWKTQTKTSFDQEDIEFLYKCAEDGIRAIKRYLFNSKVDEYCDDKEDISPLKFDILMRYATDLDALDRGEIHYQTALLLKHYAKGQMNPEAIRHLHRAAIQINTPYEGAYYDQVRCLELLEECILDGTLPVEGDKEVHCRFYEWHKKRALEMQLVNQEISN